jgi:hypothetical protein
MKNRRMIFCQKAPAALLVLVVATSMARAVCGQESSPSPDAKAAATPPPAPADMMALMMPGENHKLLAQFVGSWTYKVRFWMVPEAPPSESTGVANCKAVMDGRYFTTDSAGKFNLPGADGQMQTLDFKGMSLVGYDNGKKEFVANWIDNMGTGIMILKGTYDASDKTFTYHGEEDSAPGVKTKVRETIKVLDDDHHLLEWFEDHDGHEVKSMEISYTRQN